MLGLTTEEPSVGQSIDILVNAPANLTKYTYTADEDGYFVALGRAGWGLSAPVVTFENNSTDMNNVLSNLIGKVNSDSLNGVFEVLIPFVLVIVVVGFGFFVIKKLLINLGKGRAKI